MPDHSPTRGRELALVLLQLSLAAVFFVVGLPKATQPLAELAGPLPWVADVPAAVVRAIGVLELIGAFALVVPLLFRQAAGTGVAALGLSLAMTFAVGFRLVRGDASSLAAPFVLAVLCGVVAFVRLSTLNLGLRQKSDGDGGEHFV